MRNFWRGSRNKALVSVCKRRVSDAVVSRSVGLLARFNVVVLA